MVYEAPRFYMLGASMTAPLLWVFIICLLLRCFRITHVYVLGLRMGELFICLYRIFVAVFGLLSKMKLY